MSRITLENQGKIHVIRLNNGVTNAISPDMIDDLDAALETAKEEAAGLVLFGGEKFFSMGFDLPTLMGLARNDLETFYHRFNQVILTLFTLPMPTCCAMVGHAVAGGTILALGCDYRMAAAEKKLGLNEIKLGLPVPYLADLILRHTISDRAATELTYGGNFIVAADARQMGLVDDIYPQPDLERKAIEKVSQIAEYPQAAFAATKANHVEAIRLAYEKSGQPKDEIFFDCWFSAAAHALLKEASKKF